MFADSQNSDNLKEAANLITISNYIKGKLPTFQTNQDQLNNNVEIYSKAIKHNNRLLNQLRDQKEYPAIFKVDFPICLSDSFSNGDEIKIISIVKDQLITSIDFQIKDVIDINLLSNWIAKSNNKLDELLRPILNELNKLNDKILYGTTNLLEFDRRLTEILFAEINIKYNEEKIAATFEQSVNELIINFNEKYKSLKERGAKAYFARQLENLKNKYLYESRDKLINDIKMNIGKKIKGLANWQNINIDKLMSKRTSNYFS